MQSLIKPIVFGMGGIAILVMTCAAAIAARTEGPSGGNANFGVRESGRITQCIQSEGAILSEVRSRGNFDRLIQNLRILCQEFPGSTITIFSGYRSPQHNQAVGGASNSRHIHADAFDFRISANADRVRRVMGERIEGGRGSYEDGSFHIDLGPNRCWGSMREHCPATRALAGNYRRSLQELETVEAAFVAPPPPPASSNGVQQPAASAAPAAALSRVQPEVANTVEPYLGHGMPTLRTSLESDNQRRSPRQSQPNNSVAQMQMMTMGPSTFASLRKNTPSRQPASVASPDPAKPNPESPKPAKSNIINLATVAPSNQAGAAAPRTGASAMPGSESSTTGASAMPQSGAPQNEISILESNFGQINMNQVPAVFPSIAPPRLCARAASIQVNFCDQNYALALEARRCLIRLRQAEVVGGGVMANKSVQNNPDKQNASYNHSSYDYRVAETLSQRQLALFQQELNELRSYLGIRALPEDISPAQAATEPCWRDPSNEIQRVVAEVEKKITEFELGRRANRSLKHDTKEDEARIGDLLGIE